MNRIAMVFPGQGSQTLGMLRKMSLVFSIVKDTFSEASEILHYDLWNLVQYGSMEELNITYKTQPAILTSSVAIWRIWKKLGGPDPKLMVGHSLGEYSALVCSGAISFTDAVRLVKIRGLLMQRAVPLGIGAMAAIVGLDKDIVNSICIQESYNQVLSIAGFNTFDQLIISGHKEAVNRAVFVCKKFGAKRVFLLPISVPSHCLLMSSIVKKLNKVLNMIDFSYPRIPIVSSTDICIKSDPIDIRRTLAQQLFLPVRWVEAIQYLSVQDIKVLLEIGPGNILSVLAKRIFNFSFVLAVNDPFSLSKAMQKL